MVVARIIFFFDGYFYCCCSCCRYSQILVLLLPRFLSFFFVWSGSFDDELVGCVGFVIVLSAVKIQEANEGSTCTFTPRGR